MAVASRCNQKELVLRGPLCYFSIVDWPRDGKLGWAVGLTMLLGRWLLFSSAFILGLLLLSQLQRRMTSIPLGIQIACFCLFVLASAFVARMLLERARALHACRQFLTALASVGSAKREDRTAGLGADHMAEIRRRGDRLSGPPKDWWLAIEDALEFYKSPDGRSGWFLTRPAEQTLTEDDVMSPFYHFSFHQAVPGILTALGLLATFTAILIALSGVTYDVRNAARPVTGIDGLINGLSGKFLSSIVALVLSVIATLIEKKICERRLYIQYERVLRRVREVFPFLSQSRILLDLQQALLYRESSKGKRA